MNLKMKISFVLASLALLCPFTAPAESLPDAAEQVALIVKNRELWDQSGLTNQGLEVGFGMADLDHNGRMELIAAFKDRSTGETGGYVWEVTDDTSDVERRIETWTRDQTYGNWLDETSPDCYVGNGTYWYMFHKTSRDGNGNVENVGEYALSLYNDSEWDKSLRVQFLGNLSYNTDDEGNQYAGYEDGDGAYMTAEQYYYERLGVKYFHGYQPARATFRFYTYDDSTVQEWQSLTDGELTDKLLASFGEFSVEPV